MSPMLFLCLITHREVQSIRTPGPYLPCLKHMGIAVPVIESPGPSYFESQRLCNRRGSYFPNRNRICDLKQRILFFVPPCRSISPCRRKRDFAQNIPMFARTNSMSQSSSTSTSFSPTPNGIVYDISRSTCLQILQLVASRTPVIPPASRLINGQLKGVRLQYLTKATPASTEQGRLDFISHFSSCLS